MFSLLNLNKWIEVLSQFYLGCVKWRLNKISKTFCQAKWSQATFHAQTGKIHFCHHPIPHQVPLELIKKNGPMAIFNTEELKVSRQELLCGIQAKECDYCWKIENSKKNKNRPTIYSDRVIKSSRYWSFHLWPQKIFAPIGLKDQLTYLEISLSHQCQMACLYCNEDSSDRIEDEVLKYGHALTGERPEKIADSTLYLEALYSVLPVILKKLVHLRITGGEPMIQKEIHKIYELLRQTRSRIHFSINTNLNFGDDILDSNLLSIESLLINNNIGDFELFTSIDTWGKQAEYMRTGLKITRFENAIRKYLDSKINKKVTILVTFCALSLPNFKALLEFVLNLKKCYGRQRVILGISNLRHPNYLSTQILDQSFSSEFYSIERLMEQNSCLKINNGFSSMEIHHFKRVREIFDLNCENPCEHLQSQFYRYIMEKDRRNHTNFLHIFPQFSDLWSKMAERQRGNSL